LEFFDIILFAILAGFLGIKLYRILGIKNNIINDKNYHEEAVKNNQKEKINVKNIIEKESENNIKTDNKNSSGSNYLKNVDKTFNEKTFLKGATKAFEMILQARNAGDKKFLISYLEDKMYRIFEKEILEREIKGESIVSTVIKILDSKIEDVQTLDNIAYIKVKFLSEQGVNIKKSDESTASDTTNKLVKHENVWTFSRPLDSDNPNWKLFSV